MSGLDFNFDPSVEEGTRYELIPAGTYLSEITEAKLSATRNGRGQQLHLTGRVIEGQHEGRLFWESIIYAHVNQMATKIGRARIKDYCVACGIEETITDVSAFTFKPFLATLGIQKDKDGVYPDKNRVTRVRPREEKVAEKAPEKIALKPTAGGKTDFDDTTPF
jgi:hypothetical protein